MRCLFPHILGLLSTFAFAASSSSGASSSSSASSSEAPLTEGSTALPPQDRVDGVHRQAQKADQRTVYLWTFPSPVGAERARPCDSSHNTFAASVLDAYAATGKVVERWSVFREMHAKSKCEHEQQPHFHMLVETASPTRWSEVAKHLRDKRRMYCSAATSSARKSYWAAFAYLFAPSAKKPKEDIDKDYVLSPGHEDPPLPLTQRREGIRRLQAKEIFDTILKHELKDALRTHAFAARQYGQGDQTWLNYCMRVSMKKLKETLSVAWSMAGAAARLRRLEMTHMQVLEDALTSDCVCGGRARSAWEEILTGNNINVDVYRASVRNLFASGGGKACNHFYVGAPSTGKTALTRPVLALFGDYAFVKPQVKTSFALQGLIGAQAVVWNDFRWPHPPSAWPDLLNLLDNEGFKVAVPKVDGQEDYDWNKHGKENVISIITSNKLVAYVHGESVDPVETAAWEERFGDNIFTFSRRLGKPDRRYKQ